MAGTRSSSRLAGQPESSPPQSQTSPSSNGNKRKADSSPSASRSKKGRKTGEKEQKTLEETIDGGNQAKETDQPEDIEMKDASGTDEGKKAKPDQREQSGTQHGDNSTAAKDEPSHDGKPSCWFWMDKNNYGSYADSKSNDDMDDSKIMEAGDSFKGKNKEGEEKSDPEKSLKDSRGGAGLNAIDDGKPTMKNAPEDDTHGEAKTAPAHATNGGATNGGATKDGSTNGGAIEEDKERAAAQPSNILEKGIIYFFTRGRVGIDNPESVGELQRSHFVLRPIPAGAKLTDGTIEDIKNNRLLALPKKVWPKSPRDKFMAFVEQAKVGMDELKETFFQGSEYSTKTTGVRHTPAVTPMAEGVYAITKAGDRDETHLAYMITIPREPGEMQKDIGIASKGSFVLSLKNPTAKGPAYATLPEKPDFPEEFIEEFGGRGWMPVQPKHLDYANAQILLIGESFDDSHALDATSKDEKSDDKETPQEELEKLEGEDELRVEHLKGDDTVFEDLGLSHKEYPSVPTTW